MKQTCETIQDFLNDVHEEISVRGSLEDMGILTREDFRGQFKS